VPQSPAVPVLPSETMLGNHYANGASISWHDPNLGSADGSKLRTRGITGAQDLRRAKTFSALPPAMLRYHDIRWCSLSKVTNAASSLTTLPAETDSRLRRQPLQQW